MKSIAIKTNNSQIIEYLKKNFKKIKLKDTYFSCKNFKHFTNLIVHYKGNEPEEFIKEIATILSFLVIYEFEEDILKQILFSDYFYFTKTERDQILDNCFNIIIESNSIMKNKYKILYKNFSDYIKNNRSLYLSGFINFRLSTYVR